MRSDDSPGVSLRSSEEKIKPELKFLGLSFLDGKTKPIPFPPNKSAWGRLIETPERSQNSYPEEQGWCSPTSLAMVLMRWSTILHRPEMNVDVPECAAGVLDKNSLVAHLSHTRVGLFAIRVRGPPERIDTSAAKIVQPLRAYMPAIAVKVTQQVRVPTQRRAGQKREYLGLATQVSRRGAPSAEIFRLQHG